MAANPISLDTQFVRPRYEYDIHLAFSGSLATHEQLSAGAPQYRVDAVGRFLALSMTVWRRCQMQAARSWCLRRSSTSAASLSNGSSENSFDGIGTELALRCLLETGSCQHSRMDFRAIDLPF